MLQFDNEEAEKKYVISQQLLKSGTSVGANVTEAQSAESKAGFIHKLKISAKAADETQCWLELCQGAPSYPFGASLLKDIEVVIKVLSKIIASSMRPNRS